MSSRIESSFSDIRSSFNYYEKYKETYHILKSIPLFKKMEKKNKKLKEENQRLKQENVKLLDTICSIQSGSLSCKSKKLMPIRELVKITPLRIPNIEPCKKESSIILDDEVTIIEETPNTPNITYHVIDDDESFLENKKNIQATVNNPIQESEEQEEEEVEVEEEEDAEVEVEVEVEEQTDADEEEEEDEEEEQEQTDAEQEEEQVEVDEVESEEEEEEEEEEEKDAEAEEQEEEQVEADEVESEEEEEEVQESVVEEEQEDEVESVMINNKEYYTTNSTNGVIYNVDENGDITNEVGVFKNGVAKFY
jgi:hypothetical protein